jgi:hypothetical protein
VHRCATYQHLRGPQIVSTAANRAIPAAARAVDVAPTLDPAPAPDLAFAPDRAPAPDLAAAPDLPPAPDLAAAPTPAPEPMQLAECPQSDLDLIARGIAKAIAAARGLDRPG